MESPKLTDEVKATPPLELVSKCRELNGLHEFLQDDEFDTALVDVLKLIARNGDINSIQAAKLLVKLQAISAKLGLMAVHYTVIEKGGVNTEEGKKRNIYRSMHEYLDGVVAALKIIARTGTAF